MGVLTVEDFTDDASSIENKFTKLVTNCLEIDNLTRNIEEAEKTLDLDTLEMLYRNEFMLYIDHIALFDELMDAVDKEEVTMDNEFRLAQVKKEADKMLKVSVVDIL